MKRAVITGVGVISPFGIGWPQWIAGLRGGVSGTRRLTLFDPLCPVSVYGVTHATPVRAHAPIACHVAAEVPGFNPREWIADKDLPRVPRIVPMTLCAVQEALHSAGLDALSDEAKREVDVVIGSGGGGFSFAE